MYCNSIFSLSKSYDRKDNVPEEQQQTQICTYYQAKPTNVGTIYHKTYALEINLFPTQILRPQGQCTRGETINLDISLLSSKYYERRDHVPQTLCTGN